MAFARRQFLVSSLVSAEEQSVHSVKISFSGVFCCFSEFQHCFSPQLFGVCSAIAGSAFDLETLRANPADSM